MRKIVAYFFISLDGVVEAPETWHFDFFNDQMGEAVARQASDTMLLGRRTYEEWAGFWPTQGSEVPMADHINSAEKLVASTTLKTVEWQNSRLLRGDLAGELTKIKESEGGDVGVVGSATLVRSLLRRNLLDRLHLMVHPVVVGKGGRLFEDEGPRTRLELTRSETFTTGVLNLSYRVTAEA